MNLRPLYLFAIIFLMVVGFGFIPLAMAQTLPPDVPNVDWFFLPQARPYLIIMAIAVFAGTLIGVSSKHIQSGNLRPTWGDVYYFLIAGGLWVWFVLSKVDPVVTFTTTSALKTALAVGQNMYNKRHNGVVESTQTGLTATAGAKQTEYTGGKPPR